MKFEPAMPGGAVERSDWSDPSVSAPPPLRDVLSKIHSKTLDMREDTFVTLTVKELRTLIVLVLDVEFSLGRLRRDFDLDSERTHAQLAELRDVSP